MTLLNKGKQEMKLKLIDTSIQLFDRKGYIETSVQDIVEAIGVTKGTFYYYFKSKQEVLSSICLVYIEGLIQQQEIIINQMNKTNIDKLHDIVLLLIEDIGLERQSARIFFREMRNFTETDLKHIKVKREEFRLNVQKLVQAGIANGEFKEDLAADITTLAILGITNWSYYWYTPEGGVSEKELTEIYVDFILNGIKKND